MAESANIRKVGNLHNDIMDYMLANPLVKKGDIAKQFNLSRSWLSIVINSHAFQERLAAKQEELFNSTVIPLREKMLGIADAAMDRVADEVELMPRAEAIETADKILSRLGWGGKQDSSPASGGAVITQNNFYVGDAVLEKAREKFGAARREEAIEGEVLLIESEELRAEDKEPTPPE
jgi:hypothetical protein